MEDTKKAYKFFVKKYPDVLERKIAIGNWCIKCRDLAFLSMQVWKLLDMSEDKEDRK